VNKDVVSMGISSWELDFFGRIRSMKDAAQHQYFATEKARCATQIMIVSGVASTYYALAADRENLKLAQTTLETQMGSYDLVKRSFDSGIAAELDVHRAQAQVDSARGDVARYNQVVAQDENTLNLLVGGTTPPELQANELSAISLPKDISIGTASDVLLNRPDVVQAEDLLKAANANIGAARAAFFPRIALTTGTGTVSTELSGLFDAGSATWNFTPQIVAPIFNKQIWHSLKIAKVDKEMAITQYEKAIQNSFKEVADALAVRGTVDEQLAAQESLTNAIGKTFQLSSIRYSKGIDTYLSVLDAQRSHYAAQQGLVVLRMIKLINQIKLYSVLGGVCDVTEPTANK
jgi:multidrug efflux system outer membrane protein